MSSTLPNPTQFISPTVQKCAFVSAQQFLERWPYCVLKGSRNTRTGPPVPGTREPAARIDVDVSGIEGRGRETRRGSEGNHGWRNSLAAAAAIRVATDGKRIEQMGIER